MNSQLPRQDANMGMRTLAPWLSGLADFAAGSLVDARYCYTVWPRHQTSGAGGLPGGAPAPAASVRIAQDPYNLPIDGAFIVAWPAGQ